MHQHLNTFHNKLFPHADIKHLVTSHSDLSSTETIPSPNANITKKKNPGI